MTRTRLLIAVVILGLVALAPSAAATTINCDPGCEVTSASIGALYTSADHGTWNGFLGSTLMYTLKVTTDVYFDGSVYTYVYNLTPDFLVFGGDEIQDFTLTFIFDGPVGWVTDLSSAGVDVDSIDVSAFNTTWDFSGLGDGKTIAIFGQSSLPPGGHAYASAQDSGIASGQVLVTPEPSSLAMLGFAAVGLLGLFRRREV